MKEDVMSEELAVGEFERWADAQGIETDENDEQKKAVLDAFRKQVVKGLRKGDIIIDDDMNLVLCVSDKSPAGYAGEKLVFKTPDTKAFMAAGNYKENQAVHKLLAIASGMTGKDVGWFSKLSFIDYKYVSSVVSLFLMD